MHILTVVESYPEHFDKFEGWIKSQQLINGDSWNVKPREIRLYSLITPEGAEREVLSLLKPLNNQRHKQIFSKILKYVSWVYKSFMCTLDDKEIKPKPFKELGWWAHVTPICKINDHHDKDGKEMI